MKPRGSHDWFWFRRLPLVEKATGLLLADHRALPDYHLSARMSTIYKVSVNYDGSQLIISSQKCQLNYPFVATHKIEPLLCM